MKVTGIFNEKIFIDLPKESLYSQIFSVHSKSKDFFAALIVFWTCAYFFWRMNL